MSNEMYTHKQYIAVKIFVPGQILFKLQGFEIGEMEVEHPVYFPILLKYLQSTPKFYPKPLSIYQHLILKLYGAAVPEDKSRFTCLSFSPLTTCRYKLLDPVKRIFGIQLDSWSMSDFFSRLIHNNIMCCWKLNAFEIMGH